MSADVVRLERVSKAFRGRLALDALSLTIGRGEVVALLGPNGAGKTTTFGVMLGHLRPTAGDVTICGVAVARDRRRALRGVGVVPDAPAFHDHLSGWDNLALLVSYSAAPDAAAMRDAVRFVGLDARIDDRVRTYSHGMRRRLALAQALVPAPDLILLDEPVEGLDVEGVDALQQLIGRLARERAATVVVATHLLAHVEQLCTRAVVLDRGRLVLDAAWDGARAASTLADVYRDALARARAS